MKTPIAIIILGIVIAISIVVSMKMYIDANKYTFHIQEEKFLYATDQEGNVFQFQNICWKKISDYASRFTPLDKLP